MTSWNDIPLFVTAAVGLAVVSGLVPGVARVATAECSASDCESSAPDRSDASDEERLERARKLRDRGIDIMDADKEKALELFNRSLGLNPKDGLAWANRGTVLLNLGRHDEALDSYERSLEVRPDHAYTHCSMASVHNAEHRPEKAIEAANRALDLDPEFAPAYLNKARALEAQGHDERAAELRERALELNPDLADQID